MAAVDVTAKAALVSRLRVKSERDFMRLPSLSDDLVVTADRVPNLCNFDARPRLSSQAIDLHEVSLTTQHPDHQLAG
jgi:hypothetical protein